MINKTDMDRLLRYLANQSSYEEMRKVQLWLEKDPKNRLKFEELKKVWTLTPNNANWDTDSEWEKFTNKIESLSEVNGEAAQQTIQQVAHQSAPQLAPQFTPETAQKPTHQSAPQFNTYTPSILDSISLIFRRYTVAFAVVLIAISAGYIGYNYFTPSNSNSQQIIKWNEKSTVAGEKAEITLPDNSKVILNSESTLRYPETFSENSRDIFLSGEAYFEVTHNDKQKFNVHSAGYSTTVLGTKFNVSAFSDEENITISLLEGKVKISPDHNKGIEAKKNIFLSPNQQWVYNQNNKQSEINSFNPENAIGWKDNIMTFENVPLEKVFTKLERAYGVKFQLEGNSKNQNITTKFNGDSIWLVAEVIKRTTGLNYKSITKNNIPGTFIFY
ncbi:MAG: FecR family protein [Melioribacteraceae bacterium]